jgi:hypothetical protein
MKQIFRVTKTDIERDRTVLLEGNPELAEHMKPKRVTGNTQNAALREMLRTTAKITKATMPKPTNPVASEKEG